ncbi:uncharacterized protein LOC135926969 [Gordionus sp. m RMFG-2023]|uniref:uncharacterized protein LOC135926969 n=1 Tax=Gordionus sp. m RMFG-2023 TaxID=3053472 RepID=UPI0031FD5674
MIADIGVWINICYRIAWRRTYSLATFCNETTISNKRLIGAHGNLTCVHGCTGIVGPLYFECTDYSKTNDWTSGTYCYPYRFSSQTTNFAIAFRSCCWIPLLAGSGNWSMLMTGDLRPRRDTGTRNHAPTSGVPPIVRFQMGCNSTYTIPVFDDDNDRIKCRFATNANECGGVCNSFYNTRINEKTCTIYYEPTSHTEHEGFYPVTIVIEDFPLTGGREPLSQVPLQFLAYIFYSDLPCYASPYFVDTFTPLENTCISTPLNLTYHGQIVIDARDRGLR